MSTCRICKSSDGPLIKYGVRHYAHAACGLNKFGATFFDRLSDWQLDKFPAIVAIRAGMFNTLVEKARSRREPTQSLRS